MHLQKNQTIDTSLNKQTDQTTLFELPDPLNWVQNILLYPIISPVRVTSGKGRNSIKTHANGNSFGAKERKMQLFGY